MQIADVRTIPLSYRCETPYASAAGVQMARQRLAGGGRDRQWPGWHRRGGLGRRSLASTQVVVEQELKPLLLGEDPLLIEYLWQKMFQRTRQHGRRGIVMHAISGLDIALWDLAGKVAKLPLYRLLGAYRDRVEAYASGGFYQEGKEVPGLVDEEAERAVSQGYRAMKMKIGRNPSTQTQSARNAPAARHSVWSAWKKIWHGWRQCARPWPRRQADGRYQLRLEPGAGHPDGPGHGAVRSLLDRGTGGHG